MNSIASYLGSDHHRCDDFFAQAETHVSNANWEQAEPCVAQFVEALERHFTMEEQVLFPAFEKATGNSAGPTAVMRLEHQQMRAIAAQLREALQERDADSFLGHSETLNTMVQQHNMKEENILYPMADRVLSARRDELVGAMSEIDATA